MDVNFPLHLAGLWGEAVRLAPQLLCCMTSMHFWMLTCIWHSLPLRLEYAPTARCCLCNRPEARAATAARQSGNALQMYLLSMQTCHGDSCDSVAHSSCLHARGLMDSHGAWLCLCCAAASE